MVYQHLPFLRNKKTADTSWTQKATSSSVGDKHRYIYTKFNVVILLYYHIKTVSLRSDYWKSTKVKKKLFATLKKYTLSQWFYSFDYKVTDSKDSDSYRSKPTLFSVSRKEALNPFTPISDKRNVPILYWWTRKTCHLKEMHTRQKEPRERLSQKAVLGTISWEMWEVDDNFFFSKFSFY